MRFNPAAGVYHVEGVEEFTSCLAVPGPDRCGTLTFRLQAWGRLDAAGNTLRGGCQHWIVESGGGLAGATGFIAMIDSPETSYTGTSPSEGKARSGAARGRSRACIRAR